MLITEWEKQGLPRDTVKGAVLGSGMYDLKPVRLSKRSGFVKFTDAMEQELSALAGRPVVLGFTPHLVPLNRGIFTTASVPLAKSASTADLLALYREFYAGEPFVRVLPEGERPTTRSVVGSNFCDVAVVSDARTGRAVCVSALDNLGKGGSANGIQNLNIMMGWDERTGLEAPPVYP